MTPPEADEVAELRRRLAASQQAREESETAADILRRLELITDVALSSRSLPDMVVALARQIANLVPCDSAHLVVVTEDGPMRARATAATGATVLEPWTAASMTGSLAQRLMERPVPISITDLGETDLRPIADVVSVIGTPLTVGDQTIGAVALARRVRQPFSRDEVGLLQLAADRSAIAIDRTRVQGLVSDARDRAERAANRTARLQAVTAQLSELDADDAISASALDEALEYFGASRGVAALLDERGAKLRVQATDLPLGTPVRDGDVIELAAGGLVREVIRTGELLAGDPARVDGSPAMESISDGAEMVWVVPLLLRARPVGVVLLGFDAARDLDDDDRGFALALGRQAAQALERARLGRERASMYEAERVARAQAENRARAAQALSHIDEGVILVDRSGRIRAWNPAATSITGIAADAVLDQRVERAVPGWSTIADRIPVSVASPSARPQREALFLDLPDGEVWLSISGVRFDDGVVYAFRDVTEERILDRLRSDFVATVSHELRTPLASIYGAAMTLRDETIELDPAMTNTFLDMLVEQSQRLTRIVGDILTTSRLDAGTATGETRDVDVTVVIREVLDAANVSAENDRHQLVLTLDTETAIPAASGDADNLRQVLANLVENAVKYSPDGGRVEVAARRADNRVRITVRDQGLGIPSGERERIFEKFHRVDPAMVRGIGGTGLGLYICRELIRTMDGRIWVDSERGHGSSFHVELPIGSGAGPALGTDA